MATVARVNSSHPSHSHVVLIVIEVRCYRDGSWWNSGRRALPRCGRHGSCHIRGTTAVCKKPGAEAESRVRRWLRSRPGLRRGVDCARGRGSGESLIALEAGARARRGLRSRPGLGRGMDCARGRGSGEALIVLWLGACPCCSKFLFCRFFPSWQGYPDLWYPTLLFIMFLVYSSSTFDMVWFIMSLCICLQSA